MLDQWVVIVSGPNMIEELKRRPVEELSVLDGLLEARIVTHSVYTTYSC